MVKKSSEKRLRGLLWFTCDLCNLAHETRTRFVVLIPSKAPIAGGRRRGQKSLALLILPPAQTTTRTLSRRFELIWLGG